MRNVFMRFPGGKAKAVSFSYDDGTGQDERLAKLFTSYGLKATFNFNSTEMRSNFTPQQIEEIFYSGGHEIATHGEFHRANGNLRPIEGITEALNCRLSLEKLTGRIIRGMAYPDSGIRVMTGKSSYEQIRGYLSDLGIVYARSLGQDNDRFELPMDFYNWIPSAHHNNPSLFEYIDKFLSIDTSTKTYGASRTSRLLYIWGHSAEFDRDGNWDRAEQICKKLAWKEEIWYATNIEYYEYVEAFGRLVYSANGKRAYNPTLFTLWIDADGRLIEIAPGATVTLEN